MRNFSSKSGHRGEIFSVEHALLCKKDGMITQTARRIE